MIYPYDLIFSGLVLDIVGTVILAKGFMFKNTATAFNESLTMWNSNPHLLKSTLLQRAEAQVGAAFLIFGFLLQICGNLYGGVAATELGWINSVLRMFPVVLVAGTVAACCTRLLKSRARITFFNIFFRSDKGPLQFPNDDPIEIERTAALLDLFRRCGEPDSSFRARIEAAWVSLGANHGGKVENQFGVES